MAIKANNFVIKSQIKEEPVAKPAPQPVKEQPKVPVKAPVEEVHVPTTEHDPNKHGILIVDGKEKKVSKHSHYLLDMLSIEDSE